MIDDGHATSATTRDLDVFSLKTIDASSHRTRKSHLAELALNSRRCTAASAQAKPEQRIIALNRNQYFDDFAGLLNSDHCDKHAWR